MRTTSSVSAIVVFFFVALTGAARCFSWAFQSNNRIACVRHNTASRSRPSLSVVLSSVTEESSSTTTKTKNHRPRDVRFVSPLLEYGYRPAVDEFESNLMQEKPLFLYLPGFDSTFLCPFFQFPELGTLFDVRCMTIGSRDRSTFDELVETVRDYLDQETQTTNNNNNSTSASSTRRRPLYLAGESFGGILATEVAIQLLTQENSSNNNIDLKGLTLINAATSFDRSILGKKGPEVAKLPLWRYPAGLMQLLPLFTDRYSVDQLLLILKAEALPSILNTAAREAYMGRVAFSLPFVLPVLTQETFHWRLDAWLKTGCARRVCQRMSHVLQDDKNDSSFRILLVAGENDHALPSVEEAKRLASLWGKRNSNNIASPQVHVVPDAGHASTCGSRVNLAALLRNRFEELWCGPTTTTTTVVMETSFGGEGVYLGMEPRYDGNWIGLSPLEYWNDQYYRKPSSK